jgi:type III pantothenate kinase
VANVGGAVIAAAFSRYCHDHWQRAPEFLVAERTAFGLSNGYRQPAQLGIDRWLALLGAFSLGDSPACVVDCGSALTIDLLADQGRHLGGVILPGLGMMRHALLRDTHIPPHGAGDGGSPAATDTGSAIQAGALLAAVGAVEQAYRWHAARMARPVRLLLCGGDASALLPQLCLPGQYEPDLVLRGLLRYAARDGHDHQTETMNDDR